MTDADEAAPRYERDDMSERIGYDDTLAACREVREVLRIEGKNPEYHREQIALLKRNWPALWRAVDHAFAAADRVDGGAT